MSERSGRLPWVDLLRGAALAGMIMYHAAWDLHAFGLSGVDPGLSKGWRLAGSGIATLFLALSGFSLSLAINQGRSGRAMLLRLLRLAAAAGLVSAVTWMLAPQSPIWFGILHCILVTNVIAVALRRLPGPLLLGVALAAWLAPYVLAGPLGPSWAWTGLADREPVTLDFRPVLPWLAPVLIGLSLGQSRVSRWRWPRRLPVHPLRPFIWAGRHSLGLYLVHQPLMIAVVATLAHVTGSGLEPTNRLRDGGQASEFLRQCRKDCTGSGGDDALCRSTCDCVLTRLALPNRGLFSRKPDLPVEIAGAVAACRRGEPDADR